VGLKIVNGGKHRIAFSEHDKLELSSLEVSQAGEKIKLALLKIGPEEGMTTGQAATLFNVAESTILTHIHKHAITYAAMPMKLLQVLKSNGVINKHTPKAIFIPRQGLRDLMRVIGTDEAREAYHQIFDDAEAYARLKIETQLLNQQLADAQLALESFSTQNSTLQARIKDLEISYEDLLRDRNAFKRTLLQRHRKKADQTLATELVRRSTIFGECDDYIRVKVLSLEEMTPEERKSWNGQHAVKTFKGLGRSIESHFSDDGFADQQLKVAAADARNSADSLFETFCPANARVIKYQR
jgi:hypothetical protein